MFAAVASADTWTEVGDAGDLVSTAQETTSGTPGNPLTAITGTIPTGTTDRDLYLIQIDDPASFLADTGTYSSFAYDPQLFLFKVDDETGVVWSAYQNDRLLGAWIDGSYLPGPGKYAIGISCGQSDDYDKVLPTSSGGLIFADKVVAGQYPADGPGAADPLSGWAGSWDYGLRDPYTITLTGVNAVPGGTIPGDLDSDGCVDQADLGILLADWGCAGGGCPGDCDGDGDTDQADLGVLLAHWGEGCP